MIINTMANRVPERISINYEPVSIIMRNIHCSDSIHLTQKLFAFTNLAVKYFQFPFFIYGLFRYLSKYLIDLNLLFKALNDPTRRQILELLKNRDLTAGEIAEQFDISWPSISHHLDILRRAGLVVSEKEGQFVYYSISTTVMDEMLKWLMQFSTKKK